ncbi:unnamed protein product [Acanthosepion pharaonis]|uniref:Uncharacterized protein n=1 Tax=Acanthosepion pharaonis TaxID=158019 RepID=A0A812DEM2_ACAPH|nr:unnamed protein product [Sepia pharaonis]
MLRASCDMECDHLSEKRSRDRKTLLDAKEKPRRFRFRTSFFLSDISLLNQTRTDITQNSDCKSAILISHWGNIDLPDFTHFISLLFFPPFFLNVDTHTHSLFSCPALFLSFSLPFFYACQSPFCLTAHPSSFILSPSVSLSPVFLLISPLSNSPFPSESLSLPRPSLFPSLSRPSFSLSLSPIPSLSLYFSPARPSLSLSPKKNRVVRLSLESVSRMVETSQARPSLPLIKKILKFYCQISKTKKGKI